MTLSPSNANLFRNLPSRGLIRTVRLRLFRVLVQGKTLWLKGLLLVLGAFTIGSHSSCQLNSSQNEPILPTSSALPNIVLINADDLGYGDLGCYGATKVRTPHIDRLANEGKRFLDAHSASSVCSPSRYGLITGRYPLRRNFWGPIAPNSPLVVDTTRLTIARILKEKGYATACIGKWHLGFGKDEPDWNKELRPGPLELGFDYYFGVPLVNSAPPYVFIENHKVVGYEPEDPFVFNQRSLTEEWPEKVGYDYIGGAASPHLIYRDREVGTKLKDKAIEWLEKKDRTEEKRPFFLYLSTTNIHHPFTPATRFEGSSESGRYGDFIHELDWIVGELVKTLDRLGETENTLLIFTSDNGGMLNLGGQDAWRVGHRLNGNLLGAKFGAWEGGHRVPLIAKWPGRIPPGSTSSMLFSQVDFLATFAAIVGRPISKEDGLDSHNLSEGFKSSDEESGRESLIISPNSPSHLVVRKDHWVYIPARGEGGFKGDSVGDPTLGGASAVEFTGFENSDIENGRLAQNAPPGQLYNLAKDPGQAFNLYTKYPEKVASLDSILEFYRGQIEAYPPLGWIDTR